MINVILVLLGLVFLAGLVWFGYMIAREELSDEIETKRQMLDAEWTAMENTRRVNSVFFSAREAMRRAEYDGDRRRR
ncbi:MAG: hypothetical protein JWQ81_6158 [Amycolatopsis sp.]|uniref:hypothetical protein n=1 Tax=Amycolatopsis sp. TaxID=37632 RepID=UPI0026287281|nr:hypothetical protein [Amycolatopsis sp.]MCU1685419.1 hypothetical protein [Amycolatopsis sp.]